MRTLLFLGAGIALWLAIVLVSKLAEAQPKNLWLTMVLFGAVWFVVSAWNMWVGITSAGYSFREELPIFLLIFLSPLGVAVLSTYKRHG